VLEEEELTVFIHYHSPDFNKIEKKWANMKRALSDFIPQIDSLEKWYVVIFVFVNLIINCSPTIMW
jgi:transposase